MSVPNLDALSVDELRAFWQKHMRGREVAALFPDKPIGAQRATRDLAHYSANKLTAMRCRLEGKIDAALMYEGICQRIYANLAPWARW